MKIKIFFEYKCYPVWIYDNNGILVDNSLPKELKENINLDYIFIELQNKYNKLFTDDGIEFKYNGFNSETMRDLFLSEVKDAIDTLEKLLNSKLEVIIDI